MNVFEGLLYAAAKSAFETTKREAPPPRAGSRAPGERGAPSDAAPPASPEVERARVDMHPDLVAHEGQRPREPDDLRELDTQVRYSHWDSAEQRRAHTATVLRRALSRDGRAPDADELFWWEQHFERRWEQQQAQNRAEAARLIEERELRAIEAELAKERMTRMLGVDLREYPVLNMHGAMASAVEPFLPFVELVIDLLPGLGVFSALYQAIEGKTLLTGQKLEGVERYLGIVVAALPLGAAVAAKGAEIVTPLVTEIVRRTGASARSAYRLVKALGHVHPGDVELLRSVAGGVGHGGAEVTRARKLLRELTGEELAGVQGGAYSQREVFESYVDDIQPGATTPARPDRATRPAGDLDAHTRERLGEGPIVDAIRERSARPVRPNDDTRPTWQDSEADATAHLAGYDFVEQPSFRDGRKVPRGTRGSTRPDNYSESLKISVDVKNYDLTTFDGQENFVYDCVRQAEHRARQLPPGTRQSLMIDVRGQAVSLPVLERVRQMIADGTDAMIDPSNIMFMGADDVL